MLAELTETSGEYGVDRVRARQVYDAVVKGTRAKPENPSQIIDNLEIYLRAARLRSIFVNLQIHKYTDELGQIRHSFTLGNVNSLEDLDSGTESTDEFPEDYRGPDLSQAFTPLHRAFGQNFPIDHYVRLGAKKNDELKPKTYDMGFGFGEKEIVEMEPVWSTVLD